MWVSHYHNHHNFFIIGHPLHPFSIICATVVSMFLASCLHAAFFCVPSPSSSHYTIHPPLLRSSFPSPPLHIQPRHSFPNIFFMHSHDMSVPLLPCTFLDISPTCVVSLIISFRILSIFFTTNPSHVLISAMYYFFLELRLCRSPCPNPVHCTSLPIIQCLVHLPLDSQVDFSVIQNSWHPLPIYPSWLYYTVCLLI